VLDERRKLTATTADEWANAAPWTRKD
jgi:hypothetical protein